MKPVALLLGMLAVLLALTALYPRVVVSGDHVGIGTALQGGQASWYDDGDGLYAAVHSYRWGDPTYPARVCRMDDPERCVTVTVRDHMANASRVIDLSPEAFSRLALLSQGVLMVTVETGAPIGPRTTLPPTDTQEDE